MSTPHPNKRDIDALPHEIHILVTAGPTQEPIDEVRYIANRSSGKVGIAVAEAARDAGWTVTLLLGPTHLEPRITSPGLEPGSTDDHTHGAPERFRVLRYRTTEDLRALLRSELEQADVLVMAAAVADYRPKKAAAGSAGGKIRRGENPLTLELEPTPDLLAECSRRRAESGSPRPELLVGFALEPAQGLLEAARQKLLRKGIDMIVANPLETMDADGIEATVIGPDGELDRTGGLVTKPEFGVWLIGILGERLRSGQR